MTETTGLTSKEANTLLDCLTHNETYKEIEQFKDPHTIQEYGPPFQDDTKPSTPLLQGLVARFAVTLPGIKDVAPQFWKVRLQGIIYRLADAELSEAYDKGLLGVRKTLATAMSSLIEYPARALLGAFARNGEALKDRTYDKTNPDDVLIAWHHFLQNLIYGDLFDKLYKKAAETDDLADHDSLTQAAHEFIIVNLASFMHYTLIISPEGQTLVRLMDALNKLAPYVLIRQTLRIGNVATMINGMMRLMLAKISAASITNWVGLTTGADEGMNLLQQIMSTVLGWDRKELRKRLDKIDKDAAGPSLEVKEVLKEYLQKPREEHVAIREQSIQSKMSIVQTIVSLSSASAEMSEQQHRQALDFLSLSLAIRDRDEIINVLCKGRPDNLSEAVRDGVAAYEPMIRRVHQAVDLSGSIGDLQSFTNDLLKLARLDKDTPDHQMPSIEDFAHLLHVHQNSLHKFLHQVVKNGDDVPLWFQDYGHSIIAHFRAMHDAPSENAAHKPIFAELQSAFVALSQEKQTTVRAELAAHESYLAALHDASAGRIRTVIENMAASEAASQSLTSSMTLSPAAGTTTTKSNTPTSSRRSSPVRASKATTDRDGAGKGKASMVGPGAYLAKWQDLLDKTLVTPATAFGDVRRGADRSVREASNVDVDGKAVGVEDKDKERSYPAAPDVGVTLEVLGPRFREILLERA